MTSHCLICMIDLANTTISQKPSYNFPGSLNSTLLNDQLWSTFILTKVLDLPKWKLEHLLKSTSRGKHPSNWFVLCEICEINVVNIAEIQGEINTLLYKVNNLVNEVQDKFKSSLLEDEEVLIPENSGHGKDYAQKKLNSVSEEIRQFFKTTRVTHQTKVEINVNDTEITEDNTYDWNWEPSDDLDHDDNDDDPCAGSENGSKPRITNRLTKRKRRKKGSGPQSDGVRGRCQRSYYTPGPFQCSICPRKLKTQTLLDKHYSYHDYTKRKFNGKFDCTLCKAPCARLFHLRNHYQNVHKLELPDVEQDNVDPNFKMEVDMETGNDDEGGREESLNIFNEDQVDIGNDTCVQERTRALDQLGKVTYKFHQCTICPRKLTSESLLDKHYGYHNYTKRKYNGKFDCTLCKAPCARLFHLRNHYQNVHKLELPKDWNGNEEVVDLETQTCDTDVDDDDGIPKNNLDDNQVDKPIRKKQQIKKTITHLKSETNPYQCTLCTHKYRNQQSLSKHLECHQMTKKKYNGKFDCDKCGAPFARILHLTNHYRNVHQSTLELKKIEGQHGDSDPDHLTVSSEQYKFKCPEAECKFSCTKKGGLKYHLKLKHPKNANELLDAMASPPLVCDLCGFKAKVGDYGKQQMQRHMLNHKIFDNSVNPLISTTELVCSLCDALFKSRTDLRSHKVTIHASELGLTSPHQCSYCPRLFPNKQNLFDHEQRIHKKKGRYPCPHCDHEAMNPYRLTQHMAKHTKDRDICQYCSATYTKTGGRLREHIKRHHPDKYVPSTSRLKFGGVPLEDSELIEKKPRVRQFNCKYCYDQHNGGGILFESQLAYTMHLEEKHKDLYKFKCELCGDDERKAYMSLTSLNYHKKIHHEEKGQGVKCGWCGVKVAHRCYLYGHRKHCKSRPEGVEGIFAVEDKNDNDKE